MMNALPLFPQSASSTTGALLGGGAASLHGEGGDAVNFGALMSQSAAPTTLTNPDAAAVTSTSAAASPTGSFEDLGVILQLLRGTDVAASGGNAPNPATPAISPAPSQAASGLQDFGGADLIARLMEQSGLSETPAATLASDEQARIPLMDQMMAQFLGRPVGKAAKAAEQAETGPAELPDAEIAPAKNIKNTLPDLLLAELASASGETIDAAAPLPAAQMPPAAQANALPQPAHNPAAMAAAMAAIIDNDRPAEPSSAALSAGPAVPLPSAGGSAKPPVTGTAIGAPTTEDTGLVAAPASAPRYQPLPTAALMASPAAPAAPTAVDGSAAMQVVFGQLSGAPTASAGVDSAQAAAPMSEMLLDMTSDDGWIDQIAKDIAATKSATGDLSFRLMPRHLGRLDVTMTQGDEGISVRMEAQHESAAAIIVASQARLVDELRQQGLRIASAEVTHTASDAGRQSSNREGQNQRPDGTHFIESAPDRLPDTTGGDKGSADRRGRFA